MQLFLCQRRLAEVLSENRELEAKLTATEAELQTAQRTIEQLRETLKAAGAQRIWGNRLEITWPSQP